MTRHSSFKKSMLAFACAAMLGLGIATDLRAQVSTYQGYYGSADVDEAKGGVIYTSDDHYVSVGLTRKGSVNQDIYVVKTDRCGNVVWSNRYDIAGNNDIGRKIRETWNGDYVIVGTTTSPTNGGDAFLMRIDPTGSVLWAKTYGGSFQENGNDLRVDPFDNVYVAGMARSGPNPAETNGWIFKVNVLGNQIWSETFGGEGNDLFNALEFGCNNDIVAAGETGDATGSNKNVYVMSVSTAIGAINWARQYGRSDWDEWGNTIVNNGSNLFIGGGVIDKTNATKGLIIKIHCNSGVTVANRLYTHPSPPTLAESEIFELQQLPTGGLISVGRWRNTLLDLHLMEVNATTLGTINSSVFGANNTNDEAGFSVAVTTSTNFNAVAAGSAQNGFLGNPDLLMVVTDPSLWIPNCATAQPVREEQPSIPDSDGPRTRKEFRSAASVAPLQLTYGQGFLECPNCVGRRGILSSPELSHQAGDGVEVEVIPVSMPRQ